MSEQRMAAGSNRPAPLIVDTDPGKDDAVAILLAVAAPDAFDIRLISAAAGNVGVTQTAANIRRLCEVSHRQDIPVHAGCPRPILRPLTMVPQIHGEDGLEGADLPAPVMPLAPGHAVPAIIEAIQNAERRVSVACLAPLTNLATAFVMAPEIARRIASLVFMGGTFARGNITPYASFNVYNDPHAASIVFTSGAPVTMIGLEVTRKAMPSPEWLSQLGATGSAAARVVKGLWSNPTAFMNDACVIAYMLQPDLFQLEWRPVVVELNDSVEIGRTRIVESGPEIQVATDLDVDGFFDLLSDRLGGLPR